MLIQFFGVVFSLVRKAGVSKGSAGKMLKLLTGMFELTVECKDWADQRSSFAKLKLKGYRLRILIL